MAKQSVREKVRQVQPAHKLSPSPHWSAYASARASTHEYHLHLTFHTMIARAHFPESSPPSPESNFRGLFPPPARPALNHRNMVHIAHFREQSRLCFLPSFPCFSFCFISLASLCSVHYPPFSRVRAMKAFRRRAGNGGKNEFQTESDANNEQIVRFDSQICTNFISVLLLPCPRLTPPAGVSGPDLYV